MLVGSAQRSEARSHFGQQRLECGARANHDRQIADLAVAVEADQVQALQIPVANA